MAVNFPTSLDTFTNPTSGNDLDTAGVEHDVQHSNANDAIEALEAKVGADSSAVTTSHDYKIAQLEAVDREVQIAVTDPAGAAISTGDGQAYFVVPTSIGGMDLVSVAAAVVGAQSSSGTVSVAIYNVTQAADMLSVNVTIDANENTSYTAATGPTIDTANDDVATGDILRVDIDGAGTGAKGLVIHLGFHTP